MRKLTQINPLICDGDPYQTTVNCRAVLRYVSVAIHENARTDDEVFGRYLILEAVSSALADVEAATLATLQGRTMAAVG